ncbi:sporulation protein YunB [Sporosarcina sp. ACRSM]|uniref:sporulation protein YunB n=1 Tax=Sporosarcina sp. ACRSM TaxID=2918216 RepID=UPI001EF4A13F|nr:sporulation protein YunB [Sporosarcina sp. ACRSM]MCG7336032.1 sporulation protein YunB [Sporosarcina sp. ACRSM]
MKFHGQVTRKTRKRKTKRKLFPLLIPVFLISIGLFLYAVNAGLAPIYIQYAEVQTEQIAAHVINKALTSKKFSMPSNEELFQTIPNDPNGAIAINGEATSRVLADVHELVTTYLKEAEAGNLDVLPLDENIQYNQDAMEKQGGVVFYVPVGQAANIPLLGNLGPKIPIRLHVIGAVHADIETTNSAFGINNGILEVNVVVTVNVQIIVPLATQKSVVTQKVLVGSILVPGKVPPVYSSGGDNSPSVEIPFPIEIPGDGQ